MYSILLSASANTSGSVTMILSCSALFNNNLPWSTNSTRLVANYRAGKLYNGTNRSVYKVDFYEDSDPIAQIAVEDFTSLCSGDLIQFFSNSVALDV